MNKGIMALWGMVILLILSFILFLFVKSKDFNYIRFENSIKAATKKYISNNKLTPKLSKSIVVDVEDLIKNNYISKDNIEKYCIKDIVFSNGLFYDDYTIEKECKEE